MTDLDVALAQALAAQTAQPASPDGYARAGAILAIMGRPLEAIVYLDRALSIEPRIPEALNNRGAVLRSMDRLVEARAGFEGALALSPDYADARYNLAGTLVKLEKYREAMPHYEQLLALRPDSAEIHHAYGKLLWKTDRLEEALVMFTRSMELDATYADARADYANALAEAGHIDDAVRSLENAIELAPNRAEFYRLLAETKLSAITPAHIDALEAILQNASLNDDDRIEANFALGKIRVSKGDHQQSFAHFVQANSTRRRYMPYDEHDTLEAFSRIAEMFTTEYFESRRRCSADSPLAIFIFGMPRSGTTLIEQILASHPDVYPGGELGEFEQIVNEVVATDGPIRPNAMLAASCESLRDIAERYVAALENLAPPGVVRVTDKMPANVRFAGLIHTILPNAKMIHARRNPVDNCVSIFSLNFSGEMPWAYDLGEVGRYYRAYNRLSAHWRAVLPPGAQLEVQYEDVVDDLETQARRIVAYCGLEWHPACLEFYKADRPVKTASSVQVRQPIYRSSVNRAAVYGDLLKPLVDALG